MKSISLLPVFFAATLFLQSTVRADDPTPAKPAPAQNPNLSPREAELLKRYDKNGDGKIDEDEKAAAKLDMLQNGPEAREGGGALREQMLKRFDKNHDGQLDESERAEMMEVLRKNPRFIKRFDKNGDGKLDDAELQAAREQIAKRWNKKEAKKN